MTTRKPRRRKAMIVTSQEAHDALSARCTRALSLLAAVRRLVPSKGYATADQQAVMREADAFLAEQGVVVRAEPVVPERLAYRDGRAPDEETKMEGER